MQLITKEHQTARSKQFSDAETRGFVHTKLHFLLLSHSFKPDLMVLEFQSTPSGCRQNCSCAVFHLSFVPTLTAADHKKSNRAVFLKVESMLFLFRPFYSSFLLKISLISVQYTACMI